MHRPASLSRVLSKISSNGRSIQHGLFSQRRASRGRAFGSAILAILTIAVLLVAASPAGAQTTYFWDPLNPTNGPSSTGSDGSANWDLTTTDWFVSGADSFWANTDPSAVANIGTSGNNAAQTINLNAPITLGTINFLGGTSGSYTIAPDTNSDPLTINSAINLGSGTGAASINAPIVLGGPNLWTNSSSNTFTVGGSITNGGNMLTVGGTGSTAITGRVTGGGGLTVNNAASLIVNQGANSYSGGTAINGTINLSGTGTPLGTGTVSVAGSGILNVNGGVPGLAGQFSAGFTNSGNFATLAALQSHFASLSGLVTANSTAVGSSFNYGTTGSLFPTPFNTGTPTFEGYWRGVINITTAGQYTFGLDSDDGSMLFIDGATVVSNNNNQGISGGIEASGTLNLTAGFHTIDMGYYNSGGNFGFEAFMNPGSSVANTPSELLSNSILYTAPPAVTAIAGLTGTGTVNLATSTLQIGQVNGVSSSSTFAGSFTSDSASSLVKIGTGALTLSGTSGSSFTAPIIVNNGSLVITGNTGSARIIVGGTSASGATGSPTLAGSGTIGGAVTVFGSGAGNVAGHVAPSGFSGATGTTLNLTNGLTLNTGSNLDFDLSNSTTSGNDLISITGSGAVNYGTGGVLNIKASSGSLALGTYTLINDTAGPTPTGGAFWTVGTSTDANATSSLYVISTIGNNLDLTVFRQLTWGGQTNGNWVNSPTNWFLGASPGTFTNQAVSFGDTQFSGGTSVVNNTVTVSSPVSPGAVTFNNNSVPYTITSNDSGAQGITGTTGITLNGASTATLVGPNTYTGTTVLNSGTLVISDNSSLGSVSGTVAPVTFNGGTLRYSSSSTANTDISGRTVTFAAGGATVDLNGNSVTYANAIGNNGSGGLKLNNSGAAASLTLSGTNLFSGGTTINSGAATLISTNSTTLGSGPLTFAAAGGTLRLSGASQTLPGLLNSYYLAGGNIPAPGNVQSAFNSITTLTSTFGSLTPSPGVFLSSNNNGSTPFTTYYYGGSNAANGNPNGFNQNTNGNGLNNGTNFTIISAGSINITQAGWYTFGTTSDDGSMLFIDGNAIVNNNFNQGPTQRVGTVDLTAGSHAIEIAYFEGGGGYMLSAQGEYDNVAFSSPAPSPLPTLVPSTNNINNSQPLPGFDLPFSSDSSVNMGLSVTTVANQNYANALLVNATSNIDLGNVASASFGPLTIGSNQLNVLASGNSSFVRSLTLGAVTLTGNPTFDVASSAGTLNLGALNDGGTARTMTFQDTGMTNLSAAATSLVQGTIVNINGGNLTAGASSALGSLAQVNITGSGTFSISPSSAVSQTISSLSGVGTTSVNLNSGTLTIGSADNLSSTFAGSFADANGGTLVQSGTGSLTLTGSSTGLVSGTQVVVNGGGLNSNSSNALGTFAQVTVAQSSTLSLGANGQQFSGLNGSGTVNLNGNSLTVGNTDNVSSAFTGVLANGTGSSLIKTGTGTFRISGANTYTAGTTVNAGTLAVGPSPATNSTTPLNNGVVTLNGGTLALQGQLGTPVANPGLLMQFYNFGSNGSDLGSGVGGQSTNDLATMNTHFNSLTPALSTVSTNGATFLQFPGTGTNGATQSTGNGNSNAGNAFAAQGFAATTNFEALLTGNLTITTPGTYTFYTASDDGSVMFVNGGGNGTPGTLGEQTVNNNNNQGVTQRSGTYTFAAAGTYPIEVGYYQGGGGAGLTVSYDGPDTGDTTNNPTASTILNISNSALTNISPVVNPGQLYSNNVSVTNNSAVSVTGSLAAAMGDLTINGSTLSVNSADSSGNPYSLTLIGTTGITTLTGNATFNVSNSTSGGAGTLFLGALNDGGTARIIGFGGTGAVTLNQAANSLVVGTQVNISGGTLNSNAGGSATIPGSLGSFAQVNVGSGATLALGPGASQTISTLLGNGTVNLGNNTLTVGNTDNVTPLTPFGGLIVDGGPTNPGSIIKTGNGTLYLAGANTYNGGTTLLGGTLAVGNNAALGTGTATLVSGKLQFAGLQNSIATGGAIGIHFGTDQNGGAFALAPGSAAGIPGFVMSNWNNAAGQNGSTSNVSSGTNTGTLLNSIGGVTGASVSWASGGTYNSSNNSTPDNQLMGSLLNDGSNNGMGNRVTITNIPYASYEVVAYVGSEGGGANGRTSLLTVTANTTTQYSFSTDTFPGSNPYTYVPITNTTSGQYPVGNYAVTTGLSGSSLTVSDGSFPNGANTGLEAIEIINTTPGVTTVNLPNGIAVTGPSTMDLTGTSIDSAGPLNIGTTLLTVSGGSTGANVPFSLTLGATTLSGNPIFNVSNNGTGAGTLILGSLNDNGAASTVTMVGNGTITLNSAATSLVPGTVFNIYNGSLNSNNATALGTTATVNVLAGATFNLGASQTLSALGGSGTVNLGANNLNVGSSDNLSSNFSGTLRDGGPNGGTGASLTVGGAGGFTGKFTLSGANTYTGPTTVGSGTLALATSGSLGNTAITVNSGGVFAPQLVSAHTRTIGAGGNGTSGPTLSLNSGTLDLTTSANVGVFALKEQNSFFGNALTLNNGTLRFNVNSSGADELLVSGPSTATASVSGTNIISITGLGTTLTSGAQYTLIGLPAGSTGLLGTFEFANGGQSEVIPVGSSSYRLSLGNSATAEVLGIGVSVSSTWQPTAFGAYNWSSPTTNWTGGNVPQVPSDGATFGSSATSNQTITVDQPTISVGTLTFNNANVGVVYTIAGSGTNQLALNNGGSSFTATLDNATNSNIISAPVTLASKVTLDVATSTQLTLSGAISGSTALNINPDSGNSGTLVISANNGSSLSSPITLNAGTLTFGNGSLGSGNITLAGSSTLRYASGNTQDISSRIQSIPAAVTATIDTNGNNVSFASAINGLGGLTKIGSGTLALTVPNTYLGPTVVAAGSLRVDGSLAAASSVTVDSNATLGGGGTIFGSVNVLSSGHFAPSIGQTFVGTTTTIGNSLTLNAGAILDFNLSSHADATGLSFPTPNSSNDHIAVNGGLSLAGGSLNIDEYNGALQPGTYELVSYASGATPSASGWTVNNPPAGYSFGFTTGNANQFDLTVTLSGGADEWVSTNSQSYGTAGNWSPAAFPTNPGDSATFGANGSQSSVTIDGAYTIGTLAFTANSGFTLSSQNSGSNFSLTMNNKGNGAQVTVASNSADALQTSLVLAETTTFDIDANNGYLSVAPFNNVTTNVAISGSGGLVLTGGGILDLFSVNSYSGGTTVNNGLLFIEDGANIGTSATSGLKLNGAAASATFFASSNVSVNGPIELDAGGTLNMSGTGTLNLNGTPILNSGAVAVNSGTVKFNNTVAASGTGSVTITVAPAATLQLAGTASALTSNVTVFNHGSTASNGEFLVTGSSQTVGIVTGTGTPQGDGTVTYDGDTVVGNGAPADLTATQILQNTLTINAGSTLTIAPSGPGFAAVATASRSSAAVVVVSSNAASSDENDDSSSEALSAIQAAIASGSISSVAGQRLENRIAAIERLAATEPGLDVSLLDSRVVASLPSSSVWTASGSSLLTESNSGLLNLDTSAGGSTLGAASAAFASTAGFAGSPAAVPEPSTLLLAVLGGLGVALAARRRLAPCR